MEEELTFAEKIRSIGFSRGAGKREDKMLSDDLAAYKRLRLDGLQPPRIDGCAILEKEAVTRQEIETGAIVHADPTKRKTAAAERREATLRGRDIVGFGPPPMPKVRSEDEG